MYVHVINNNIYKVRTLTGTIRVHPANICSLHLNSDGVQVDIFIFKVKSGAVVVSLYTSIYSPRAKGYNAGLY